MAETALSDVKIVELGGFFSAPYCTKLMADMGAEVVKIEEPGAGDSARRYGPFPGDDPDPERSLLFAYLNTNKLSVTLDVKSAPGKKLLQELLRDADILVESYPPKLMTDLGLDYSSLAAINEKLIVTSITPFGQSGPYRDYKATDLVTFHIGGIGYPTPGDVEDPESNPPLKLSGHQAHIMAGVTAASGTMSALFARDFTGRGQHVEVSEQESLVRAIGGAVVSHVNRGETPTRIAGMGRPIAAAKSILAKDGYFNIMFFQDHFWESMKHAMGNPEWMDGELFDDLTSRRDNSDAILLLVEEWSKDYTKAELYQNFLVEHHVPCSPVNDISDILSDPHFQARGTFMDMEHPAIGSFKAPAPPFDFPAIPRQHQPAPALGQHNEAIICGRLGYSRHDLVRMRQSGVV
jgi:crotonobetainyl-CoA:carnitine CoA-transferase CaiB-like acyl-CoA transferase